MTVKIYTLYESGKPPVLVTHSLKLVKKWVDWGKRFNIVYNVSGHDLDKVAEPNVIQDAGNMVKMARGE